jgi:predicted flap endonuclease-1-like 5' DNA nuclease
MPDEDDLDMVQRFGQAGLVAYAQMARVTILRVLEGGAPSDDQELQIGAQVDGLSGNVQPFLAELMRTFGRFSPTERNQMGEIVLGVQRNVVALSRELETSPWPTAPAQHEDFRRMIEDLRHRLAPLLNELDVAAQALQTPAEPVSEPEPTQARSYRDNLTTIHGIGPALQQRLDRAGICTYIQLALSSPEDLRKALGDAGRLANVEDWIVQARSLAGMPS